MKELGKDARELLDAAVHVDAIPSALRHRGRRRLIGTLAAGVASSSALAAEGAWMAANVSIAAGAPVSSGLSLAGSLVSAIAVGLSTGLVALSPTTPLDESRISAAVQSPAAPVISEMNRANPNAASAAISAAAPPASVADSSARVLDGGPAHVRSVGPAVRASGPTSDGSTNDDTRPRQPLNNVASGSTAMASIVRETELLAQAHRALQGKRATAALHILERYDEEFPQGALREEATASRVVALCAAGHDADAVRVAGDFLRTYPASPLTKRVRSACSGITRALPSIATTKK